MVDPPQDEEYVHICPHCKKPVPPGFKFCEVCGAKATSILTCSKCGTQFVHLKKYCDCCGARFVPKEYTGTDAAGQQEPEEAPAEEEGEEPAAEEEAEPEEAGEEAEEPEFEGAPEPAAEEEDPDREPGTAAEPVRKQKRIPAREPDTQELLEEFGKEYDDEETTESSRRERRPAQKMRKPAPDALVPVERERRPAKIPAGTTRIIGGGIALIIVLAAVWLVGLPVLSDSAGPSPAVTPALTVTPQTGAVITPDPTTVSGPLVPKPTETVPDQKYSFVVRKDPLSYKISVIFVGSATPGTISSADVKVTHSDGAVATGTILPLKGISEIFLNGSKGADRVEIIVKMASGKTYRVYDTLISS